jgi:HTH-type transcriptional regulator/antitoxin HipB
MPTTLLQTPANIGALIRDRREHLGLDQAALANQVGVSRLWINQMEHGKPNARISLILRTFTILGIELTAAPTTPAHTQDINAIIDSARGPGPK